MAVHGQQRHVETPQASEAGLPQLPQPADQDGRLGGWGCHLGSGGQPMLIGGLGGGKRSKSKVPGFLLPP
jgi:hypothetical protein